MFYRSSQDCEAEALRSEVEAVVCNVRLWERLESNREVTRRINVTTWPGEYSVRVTCFVHHYQGFSSEPNVRGMYSEEWTAGLFHELAEALVHSGLAVCENRPIDLVTSLTVRRIV